MSTADQTQHIFQEILLEHGTHPRHDSVPTSAAQVLETHDPLKGDRVRIGLQWDGDRIAAIGFTASGSTVLKASCSLLAENLHGKPRAAACQLTAKVLAMLQDPSLPVTLEDWGELAALSAIRRFPARVQCASMPWRLADELLATQQ